MSQPDPSGAGQLFVDSMLESGLLRRADLEECVALARDRSSEDGPVAVTDVLIEQGYLTPYQFKKLRRRLEKLALIDTPRIVAAAKKVCYRD